MDIEALVAERVRNLRKTRELSLDALADVSGVSRSMISLIERGETSPTAAVLNKLADALGVSLAQLFAAEAGSQPQPLSLAAHQHVWKDPQSGYVRRHLSPSGYAAPIELVEVLFPAHETVTFDNLARNVETHQQVWLLEGKMIITLDGTRWQLEPGDCLAMTLGQRISFHNPGSKAARYVIALASTSTNPRKRK